MVTGVSTFGLFRAIQANNTTLQNRFNEVQLQLSSGLKSVDFKGISRVAEQVLDVQTELKQIEGYLNNIQVGEVKYNLQATTLDTMIDRLNSFKADIAASMGAPPNVATDNAFVATAQSDLDDFIDSINGQINGEYLFSGTAWNVPPIDDTVVGWAAPTVFAVGGPANTTYYQGNTGTMAIPIGDALTVDLTLRGDDPGIEQALRAFRLITDNPGSNAARTEALGLADQAIDALSVMRARISSNASTAQTQKETLTSMQAFIENHLAGLKEADVAEATILSQAIQSQLEASFAITARTLSLSLTDYIR